MFKKKLVSFLIYASSETGKATGLFPVVANNALHDTNALKENALGSVKLNLINNLLLFKS